MAHLPCLPPPTHTRTRTLAVLDLSGNSLTGASVELLLPLLSDELMLLSKASRAKRLETGGVHASLTRLVLDCNPIGDAGAELLCEAVGQENCRLQELHLSRCSLGERAATAIGKMLEESR